MRADTPAARAERPNKKCVQQLVNGPYKNRETSSYTTVAMICARDLHLGELNRAVEEMIWQDFTVCEFKIGGG